MEYVTRQEYTDLVAAVVANGECIAALEADKRQKLEDGIYNTLPLSVVAEIIEEEVTAAEAELGL